MYGVLYSAAGPLGSAALGYRRLGVRQPWRPPARNGLWRHLGPARLGRRVDAAQGPTTRTERIARLEAVLFLARDPLGSRKLADLSGLADGTEARTLVRRLNRMYDLEGCAFRVVEVAGGFQLMSRPRFAPWLRRLSASPVEVRLSAPAMETLAVVAYRQPVLRAAIEAVRGVQCGEVLRQLMERDLVRIVGRSEELGRPFLYGTTRRFLQVFGLRHLDELPRLQLSRPTGPDDQHGPAESTESSPHCEMSGQPVCSSKCEGGSNVTIAADEMVVSEETSERNAATLIDDLRNQVSNAVDDYDEDDYEDEGYKEEEYEEEEEEEEEEEDEEGEEEEDFEDDDWGEVVEEDEEEDEDDEDWEDDDWDEDEEDDDWDEDEEDDDWDEDEEDDDWDEDWDDEEE